jgi:hypothetical protein
MTVNEWQQNCTEDCVGTRKQANQCWGKRNWEKKLQFCKIDE